MATTGRSSGSSSVLRPPSSSQRLHNHHRHRQRSASPCNLNIRLRCSPGNVPKPSAASVTVSFEKRKCLCSPTTHPGSFRCAYHRRLDNEKIKTLGSSEKHNNTTRNAGLNLRKVALMNSLARIGSVEAERFRRSLAATLVKSSSPNSRRPEFRLRRSRFYTLHKDQD